MEARLEDGSIVTLEKDCSCIDHQGPHWLHSDHLFRQLNLQLLGPNKLQTQAFAIEEQASQVIAQTFDYESQTHRRIARIITVPSREYFQPSRDHFPHGK